MRRFSKNLIVNLVFFKVLKFLDLPQKILYIFDKNSTEYLENIITGLMSLTLFWLTRKIVAKRVIKKNSYGLINLIPELVKQSVSIDIIINPYPILYSKYDIDVFEDIKYNSKRLSSKDLQYCQALQSSIRDILLRKYKLDPFYCLRLSHALANHYLRKRHEKLTSL